MRLLDRYITRQYVRSLLGVGFILPVGVIVRVEVVGFSGSTSVEMRAIADRYIELGGIAHRLRP